MYSKSITGNILFESKHFGIAKSVEEAVRQGVNLDFINLRRVNLSGADLDDAIMNNVCLWGADLTNTNMTDALLRGADLRNARFKDTCLAQANCYQADFRGAYFSNCIVEGTDFSESIFTCPSVFSLDLALAKNLNAAIYYHKGEVKCDLSCVPIVIQGFYKKIVILKNKIIIGHQIYDSSVLESMRTNFLNLIHQENILQSKIVK